MQASLYQSDALHNVVAAGRRSFKTERAKRKLIMGTPHHPGAMTLDGGRFFAAAPTHAQAKRIYWDDLKTMTRPFWKGDPSESELTIYLKNGSRIVVLGLDKPSRIEGAMWHGGILDEYADMKAEAWSRHVQPVTSDTGAWVDFIGVPEGQHNHFYDLKTLCATNPDFRFFTWHSADVLPPAAIARALETLDERTFRQEYEASFETSGTTVYYAFDDESIVDQEFDPTAETVMAWDFNVDPMTCILIQPSKGERKGWTAVKEFVYSNSHTEETCRAIDQFFEDVGFRGSLQCTGDHTGNSRKTSATRSDYRIIESFFKNRPGFRRKTRATKSIRDRVAATNSLLRAADGTRRLFVARSCKKVITDLQRVQWKESGQGLDDENGSRTHESDALSYFPYNWFPVDRAQKAKVTRR